MSGAPQRLQRIERSAFMYRVSSFLLRVFGRLYLRMRCEGLDHVPASGAVLLVANHASFLDPPMLGANLSRPVDFLAQAGLARFAPMRWWMRQVGVTLIDRHAPSKEAMRLLVSCLKAGDIVGVFPEGTRSPDGRVGPFKSGVEFLVRRARPVVVPVGIEGTWRAMPRGAWFPRPRKVTVRYGRPWSPEEVLAEGGIEKLRREVARLANAELRPDSERPESELPDSGRPEPGRPESGRPESGRPCAGLHADTGDSVTGCPPTTVDPSASSTSSSAGGGA